MEQVNKEALRILVADIGFTEASARTGIKRDTLYKWAQRKGWKEPVQHAQSKTVQSVQSPSVAHAEAVAANGNATKLGLSEYAKRQAQHLATKGKLKDHGAFRNVTAGASQLHGWNEQGATKAFSLNVLNLGELQIGKLTGDAVAHTEKLVEGLVTDQPTG